MTTHQIAQERGFISVFGEMRLYPAVGGKSIWLTSRILKPYSLFVSVNRVRIINNAIRLRKRKTGNDEAENDGEYFADHAICRH